LVDHGVSLIIVRRYVNNVDMSETELDKMIALFFLSWRAFAAQADLVLEKKKLARMHHRVLFLVVRMPGIRVGDLADALGVSRQALHRPLGDLQRQKLVQNRASPTSKRERALFPTAAGTKIEAEASGVQRAQLRAMFKAVGVDASKGWVDAMQALAAPVLAENPRAAAFVP
jgi:DNA-binding MarR family transcriptional regulator